MAASAGSWLMSLVESGSGVPGAGRVTLVCCPYAGAAPTAFLPLARALADQGPWPGLRVLAAQLPGRGRRIREAPARSLDALAGPLAGALAAEEGPLVLYGHSMGALLAYAVARTVRPAHLVVSGSRPPGVRGAGEPWHLRSDEELVAGMVRLGASAAPFDDPGIRALALPVLRADLRATELWDPEPGPPLASPVTAVAGARDAEAPPGAVSGWSRLTGGAYRQEELDGGHFLLEECLPELAGVLGGVIRRTAPAR
ncbi:alpha/beta fold hydrolase [Streptomyces sp. NPDC000594]|uniref:thioesterase II family protein n=1 Tax=Streptomyces sp. NPDC000594 TaxID=3154261 RepID=UPI0033304AFB